MTARETLLNKDPKRRAIEVAENMVRITLLEALASEHPKKSRIHRTTMYGVSVTQIEVENLKRRFHLLIRTIKSKTVSGWETAVYFDLPQEALSYNKLCEACENLRKLVTA